MRIKDLAAISAFVALTFLCIEGGLFIGEMRKSLPEVVYNANAVLTKSYATMNNVDSTVGVVNDAAKAQAAYWPKELRETQKVTAAAKELIVRTNLSLNGGPGVLGSLPQMAQTIGAATELLRSGNTALASTQPIIANLLTASKGAADTMSDPDIPATLHDIRTLTENMDGATEDIHTETTLLVGQTRKAFAPKNKALSLLQMLGGGTVNGAELFYYFTH